MQAVIEKVRYDTEVATLIASDRYFDGSTLDRRGRNTYLYRSRNGRYFVHRTTMWQGERDSIEPISKEQAMHLWEALPEREMGFEEAFPGETVEEA